MSHIDIGIGRSRTKLCWILYLVAFKFYFVPNKEITNKHMHKNKDKDMEILSVTGETCW